MLGSINADLRKQFEKYFPRDMINELKSLYEQQAGVELFDLVDQFHDLRYKHGTSVSPQVLQLKRYSWAIGKVKLCLSSAYYYWHEPKKGIFQEFVRNYNMHSMSKTKAKLHIMLIMYEKELPRESATPRVLMIKGGRFRKQNNRKLRARTQVRENKLCQYQNLKRPFQQKGAYG